MGTTTVRGDSCVRCHAVSERLNWTDGERDLQCRVCGHVGVGSLIATVTELAEVGMPIVRCPSCGSLQMTDDPMQLTTTDWDVNQYVENGAGLGAILDTILLADTGRVRRFLDVGCNYGFSVDMGRTLFGWEAMGVEPSHAGRRGAAELGCDIRPGYLTLDSEIGPPFDLVMASEVLEHVPEPLPFLAVLHARLAAEGMLVLTTPAAEVVTPEHPEQLAIVAISPGFHVFLATAHGLSALLERAGFVDVHVERRGGTLHAVCRRSPSPARRGRRPRGGVREGRDVLLDRYLAHRLAAAPDDSVLAVGLATRALREFAARGDWARVASVAPAVIQAFHGHHRLDLTDPAKAALQLAADPACTSFALGGAAYSFGMHALLAQDDAPAARSWFDLCRESIQRWWSVAGEVDLDSHDLYRQATIHGALAAARFDAADALRRAVDVHEPERTCRLLVELVVRGTVTGVDELCARAAAALPQWQHSSDAAQRAVAADTLYALGVVAMSARDDLTALRWFLQCIAAADRDAALQQVGTLARDHVRQIHQRLSVPNARPDVHHMVDVYWCDPYGTYLSGWAVVPGVRIDEMRVRVGATCVPVERHVRPDLQAHWPHHAHAVDGGFTVHVNGSPHGRAVLEVVAEGERIEIPLDLDHGPLPPRPAEVRRLSVDEMIIEALAVAPPGPVLFIGMREPDDVASARVDRLVHDRFVVSLDVHPGVGVTVVGDAHSMSRYLRPASFAAVISLSVLEHVTAPWVVAAEVGRVLMPGGIALHAVPWTWPTHSQPNDFWRMSPAGLESLFGPGLGFEVVRTEVIGLAAVVPQPEWRSEAPTMPTTLSPAMCSVLARKVNATPDVVWPMDIVESARGAQRYPVDGLLPAKGCT